ncbi:hypothetical protein JCM10213_002023 [Rhodosporidiobolus nylandii]
MNATGDTISLLTSLSYSSSRAPSPYSLLPRHISRLKTAHARLAREAAGCWCAPVGMLTDDTMLAELARAVKQARKTGNEGDLRRPVSAESDSEAKYDEARERQGATLNPSPDPSAPPFDVIIFNRAGEVTETSISNVAFPFSINPAAFFVTPSSSCGLLEGVQRADLLEKGEVVEGVIKVDEMKKTAELASSTSSASTAFEGVFKAYIPREGL